MHTAILGAGIGGLTLANYLIKQGKQVTLFEAHHTPGGYTAGFKRNGFYFESGTLSFESAPQVFRVMRELGVYDKIRFTRQKSRFSTPHMDGTPEDWPQFQELLLASYPEHTDGLRRYFAETQKLIDLMTMFDPGASKWSKLRLPINILNFLRYMMRYRRTTVTDLTAKYFDRTSELFWLLKSFGYPDMAAWILGGAIYTIFYDYYGVEGGMQSWADVLAESFQAQGGRLMLKSPVERILTRNGKAVGVVVNSEKVDADVVVSSMDFKKTFLKLLDDPSLVPLKLRRKIADTAVSEGVFTVYLGLSLPNERLRELLKREHTFFFDDKYDADVYAVNDADYFSKSMLSLYSPSLMNCATPAGKSSLMISSVAPHRWMSNWGAGDREVYESLKAKAMETLIRRCTRLLPELAEHIEIKDAATPLTYERYTGNTDGATSAFSWNPKKRFYKSLISQQIKTPVKNLYIGSCWATQIGGVPSAIMAAEKIAKALR